MFPVARMTLPVLLVLLVLGCQPGDDLAAIRQQHSEGRFQASLEPLRKIVDADPSNPDATMLLGRALMMSGNSGLAVWPLRRATEVPEYAVEAGLLLAEAMIASRAAPDALEEIDLVLSLEPDNMQARVLRAEANQANGKFEDALEDVERALDIDDTHLPLLISRVTLLISLKEIEEAGEALSEALESFESSDETVSQPMLARLCMARALFSLQDGKPEIAETQYAECIEKFPTEQIAVTEAVSYYDRVGRIDRATEILEAASEVSEAGLFRTQLARRRAAFGDFEEEERLLRLETEERPTAMSWFVLADSFVRREQFDEALEAFEAAIEINPNTSRLRFAYADTLVRTGRFKKAGEVASRLEHRELMNLIRGRIFLGEGDARRALAAFERGIELWPNNAVGRFLAGQAAERVGNFPRALSHYRESFRTSPGDSEAGRALVELYALNGQEAGGLRIAGRYVEVHRQDPKAYLMSIRLAHQMKRHKIVVQGLQRLSRLPGQAPIAIAEEASILASDGHTEQAAEVVETSTLDLTNPANAVALRVFVELLGTLEQHAKAADLLNQALSAHPDEAVFHELLGGALHQADQAEEARASFDRALELDDQSWRTLAGLASLSAGGGQTAEALSLYDRALAANPDDPGPALSAVGLLGDRDPEEAIRRYEALLDAHPRTPAAANSLAEILVDRNELDRANRLAQRAAWFGLPEAQDTLARIRTLRGEAAPAAADSGESSPSSE